MRISLFLVLVGLSGLFVEIINAFEYVQGARNVFKVQRPIILLVVDTNELETLLLNKIDADCIGSKNKCSASDSISFKDGFNLS